MPKYASVLVDESGGRAFDYEVPPALTLAVGTRVRVPVRMRSVLGTIIALSDTTEASGVRPITDVVGDEPALSAQLIRLAEWMSDYYCCPIEAAMRTVLPNVIRKAEVGHKMRLFLFARNLLSRPPHRGRSEPGRASGSEGGRRGVGKGAPGVLHAGHGEPERGAAGVEGDGVVAVEKLQPLALQGGRHCAVAHSSPGPA